MGGTLAGAVATFSSTVGITGVTTHGGNVVSDADSTDDLGTTGVRWANLWVDAITMGGTLAGAVGTFSSTLAVTGNTTIGAGATAFLTVTNTTGTGGTTINAMGGPVEGNFKSADSANTAATRWTFGRDNQTTGDFVFLKNGAAQGRFLTGSVGMTLPGTLAVTGTLSATDITASGDVLIGTNPASTGDIRINKNFGIFVRNADNSGDRVVMGENAITGAGTLDIGDNTSGRWDRIAFHVGALNTLKLEPTLITADVAVIVPVFTASGATVKMTNLPTSDPGVAGQLWNSSATMKISAG